MSPFSQLISLISFIIIVNYVSGQILFTCPDNYTEKYPDISNCHRYWQCQQGNATRNWCSLGWRFDRTTASCKEASKATCGICHSFGVHVAKIDCKNYRLCIAGKAIDNICPEGTFFDENVGECNVVKPEKEACPFEPCQGAGSDIVFQRDKKDCRSYHICFYERLAETRKCPIGTWFDNTTCTAIFPEECVDCDDCDGVKQSDIDIVPAVPKIKTSPAQGCPSEGTTVVMSDGDCTKYSICSAGRVLEERICPKGLYFSEDFGVCAPSTNVYCPF